MPYQHTPQNRLIDRLIDQGTDGTPYADGFGDVHVLTLARGLCFRGGDGLGG